MNIENTLQERETRYGEYMDVAIIAQSIKYAMQQSKNWSELDPDQMESLDMIANKIGRILNGDPNYDDSWHDIAGYATLIAERLRKDQVME